MLLVCNGAYKSGSTWLFRILQSITGFDMVPRAYHAPGWEGTGIHPPLLRKFLETENYRDHNYIVKGHFFERWHLLSGRPNVLIANITRDTRDVVVSAYFYERMKGVAVGDPDESMADYYKRRGWKVAKHVVQYNALWRKQPATYMSSYDALHNDFANECRRLAAFVGKTVSDEDIERIREENSLQALKQKYDERSPDGTRSFYRKGVIGDWKEHLTDDIVADIARIERKEANFPGVLGWLELRLRYAYVTYKKI